MKILISGASGLIGREIAKALSLKGCQILSLNRRRPQTPPYWDIKKKIIQLGANAKIDAVIHLAGENIAGGWWTSGKKNKILNSRVEGTKLIAGYFSEALYKPKVIISGSAVGYYGNRGGEELTENSAMGSGFLSEVCYQWEKASEIAAKSGIRVVNIRFGMVLSEKGGALAKMLVPFRAGLGGVVGDGKQYISWITMEDVVEAIGYIIKNENLNGPVNLVSPAPVTNDQFTKILGQFLRKPTVLPFPAFLAKLIFGEMANELLLASAKVQPKKLLESGYSFKHPTLETAFF
jgi:uncharacterized protein (TIGR01777 family)